MKLFFYFAVALLFIGNISSADEYNPNPPAQTVRLVFIHHSTGEGWLIYGGLRQALNDNNYYVTDTNYGWGPDSIGDRTDIGHWYDWFLGPNSGAYLEALYSNNHVTAGVGPNTIPNPGGSNNVIMFKSCFPNGQNISGNTNDPPLPQGQANPIYGDWAGSESYTVSNIKGMYRDLLDYFSTHQEKLFVLITTPPSLEENVDATSAANNRAIASWLIDDWLKDYAYNNVFAFDYYNVLTSNGGGPNTNDLGALTGNHHRFRNGAIEHVIGLNNNYHAYAVGGDDHPTPAGQQKATGEFIPLLNIACNKWYIPSVAVLYANPTNIDLGTHPAGYGFSNSFIVKNNGGGTLGGNISESASWITTLNPTTFSLTSGQQNTISFSGSFPSTTGAFNTNISVTSNGGNQNVYVHGYTTQSCTLPPLVTYFAINGGASSTTNQVVILNNTTTNSPTEYMASHSSTFAGAAWQPYSTAPSFTVSAGSGIKKIYFKTRNACGVSNVKSDPIVYTQSTQPSQPPVVTSFAINNGAPSTANQTATLNNTATNSPTYYMASENSSFTGASWLAYSTAPSFTLTAGYGTKTVYLKVKNGAGESSAMSDTINYIQQTTQRPVVTSFAINNGASSTASQTVTLNHIATGNPTHYMASHISTFSGASWQTYSTAPSFTMSAVYGIKKVYFKVKNTAGESNVTSDTIVFIQASTTAIDNFIIQKREMEEGWSLISFSVNKCFYQGEPPANQPECVELVNIEDLGFNSLAEWFSSALKSINGIGGAWSVVIGPDGAMDSSLPDVFNTMRYMSPCSGYQVKINEGTGGAILSLNGQLFNPGCPIPLMGGWNTVGYPLDIGYYDTDSPPDLVWVNRWVKVDAPVAEYVFKSIAGKYNMITGDNGAYDPALPAVFSSLHYIAPGCGYKINMTQPGSLLYNQEAALSLAPVGKIRQVDLVSRTRPKITMLGQNYPNPFNPDTWIPYQLMENAVVEINIYSATGQLVRRLELGNRLAGFYTDKERAAHWDGRNEAGEYVASGVYFYNIKAGEFSATRKMVVRK